MRLINLLPWRQIQRQQRVRRWSLFFSLVLVLVPLLVMGGRQFAIWEIHQQQAQKDYLTSMQSALQRLYQQRLVLQKQNKKYCACSSIREAQQKAIQIWEKRLIHLATLCQMGPGCLPYQCKKGNF